MGKFDVITVGNAMLDIFLHLEKENDFVHVNKETRAFSLRAGSKVLLDSADLLLGGNASNVAVGLSRQGFSTALVAELGDDEFSSKLTNILTKEKVNLDFIKQTKGADSSFSVILDILGDRTAFVRHVQRKHDISLEHMETQWVFLTSVGKDWHSLYRNVLAYKKEHNVQLAFNPGSAQIAEGVESFVDVLKASDILFVNREEAEIILYGKPIEKEKRETEENILFRIQRIGPKVVVMTDGDNGSFVLDEKAELFYEKSARCSVVEKTGAGDAYSSGFLGAILAGKTIPEAMRFGAANAASVIEHVGATAGLLTRDTIEDRMKKSYLPIEETKA